MTTIQLCRTKLIRLEKIWSAKDSWQQCVCNVTVGRRQLEARGASRDLDTWKWTRDDGGDDGYGDSDDDRQNDVL